ncbi:MAG: DUF4262 domain-containing protein [Planctomycetes bacterium]|nr:DUF4262 domain-containing protein [Planctomycetota bacterium]
MHEANAEGEAVRTALADIAEQGLHIHHVAETDAVPEHAFTVGMWQNWRHPEVIAFGLPAEVLHALFELIADEVDSGRRLVSGQKYDDFLSGYPILIRAVPKAQVARYLPLACRVNGDAEFEVLQVCWPDRRGRWPWEEGAHESVRQLQPILERLPEAEVQGG